MGPRLGINKDLECSFTANFIQDRRGSCCLLLSFAQLTKNLLHNVAGHVRDPAFKPTIWHIGCLPIAGEQFSGTTFSSPTAILVKSEKNATIFFGKGTPFLNRTCLVYLTFHKNCVSFNQDYSFHKISVPAQPSSTALISGTVSPSLTWGLM